MAIGAYYDVYRVGQYEDRVSNIKSSIAELKAGDFYIDAKGKILEYIKILKGKEAQFLSKLQIPGVKTLEDLNRHLAEYRRTTLSFSGPALVKAFTGILEAKNAQEYEFFEQEVTKIITHEILHDESIENKAVDWAYQQVMAFLNQDFSGSKGIDTSFRSKKGFADNTFYPNSFTSAQKRKWKKIIAERMKAKGIGNGEWDMEVYGAGTTLVTSFNWFGVTKEMTQTQAMDLTEQQRTDINNEITEAILAQVTGVDNKALLRDIISHVLSENEVAFFVGRNVNEITGILGEIQGLFYFSKLFGGVNATRMPENLKWRGGTYTGASSKKPHQDILFENFGIQVKNSTKQDIGSIGFAEASLETMLSKTEMSEEAKNVFYNFYGTLEFNVPYHKEGSLDYRPGLRERDEGAQVYSKSRKTLENCEKDINELMNLFAAAFMYMDVAENFDLDDANTFYLIGGTALYAASSILQEVLDKLEQEEKALSITSDLSLGRNIIQALNSGKTHGFKEATIANVKLTSSFKF